MSTAPFFYPPKRINRDEILMRYHADTAGVFTFLQRIFVPEWYACQNILGSFVFPVSGFAMELYITNLLEFISYMPNYSKYIQ